MSPENLGAYTVFNQFVKPQLLFSPLGSHSPEAISPPTQLQTLGGFASTALQHHVLNLRSLRALTSLCKLLHVKQALKSVRKSSELQVEHHPDKESIKEVRAVTWI